MSEVGTRDTSATEPSDVEQTGEATATKSVSPPVVVQSVSRSSPSDTSPDETETRRTDAGVSQKTEPEPGDPRVDETGEVGRFQVLSRLGRGAMGVVYAAYDPKLDRNVAIKLVDLSRIGSNARDARARLEREAQAAATLSHPNVVTVYDVGQHHDGAFMAMELVEGPTLRTWLRETQRATETIVAMFVEIGRGLHAAHQHDLVHRDFKPGNVLIGDDGRPRIADFGLASRVDGWTSLDGEVARRTTEERPHHDSVTEDSHSDDIICGTPAYMAPEQYRGRGIGPHTDQFAFAVTLWEALHGVRPFRGPSVESIGHAVLAHDVKPPEDEGRQAPRALLKIVERGMAHRPEDRYADVAQMVGALEHYLAAPRRRLVMAATGGMLVIGVGIGYQTAVASKSDPCDDVRAPIDALWSSEVQGGIEAALDGASWSERWPDLQEELGRYVEGWASQRDDACTATRRHATASEHAMQLRFACLDRAAITFEAVTTELASGASERVDPSASLRLLAPLDQCEDLDVLSRFEDGLSADKDPQAVRPLDDAWRGIALARARRLLGKGDWETPAQAAQELAQKHDFAHVGAWANLLLGTAALQQHDDRTAASALRDSVSQALAVRDQTLATSGMLRRAEAALERGEPGEARVHLDYANAALPAVVDERNATYLHREIVRVRGRTAKELGEFTAAVEFLREAADHAEQGEWRRDPQAQGQLGTLYGELGVALKGAGRPEESIEALERALDLFASLEGSHAQYLADTHQNIAVSCTQLQRFERAEAELRKARALYLEAEAHPATLGTVETNWGWLERERGRLDAARTHQEAALDIYAKSIGAGHVDNAYPLIELAQIDRKEGQLPQAMERIAKAGQLRAESLGPRHPETAFAYTIAAWILLDLGQLDAADGALGQARVVFEADPNANPLDAAVARYVGARLLDARNDPGSADALSAVETELRALGAPAASTLAELEDWRASLSQNEPD